MAFAISEGLDEWLARYEVKLFCVVIWWNREKMWYRVKETSDRHETLGGGRAHEMTAVGRKEHRKDVI